MNVIFHTAKVACLHKLRNENFMVLLLFMSVLAMVFFPQSSASYQTVVLDGYRGTYNSAWIGGTLALLNVTFLPLILFYCLRGNVQGDFASRRSDLFGATQLTRAQYILGKTLSNFGLSLIVVAWMTLIAMFMQLWIGEDRSVNPIAIILPQLMHVIPLLVLVASLITLFDTIKFLQGGLGNILYFFLACAMLVLLVFDITGTNFLIGQMKAQLTVLEGPQTSDFAIGISTVSEATPTQLFSWMGANYQQFPFVGWVYLGLVSMFVIFIAILCFKGFSQNTQDTKKMGNASGFKRIHSLLHSVNMKIAVISQHSVLLNLIRQEYNLLVAGKSVWIGVILTLLWALQLVLPMDLVITALLPAVLLVNALLLSGLGQREAQYQVQQLMINSDLVLRKQFPAMLIAGSLLLTMSCLPAIIRFGLSNDWYSIALLMSGFLLIVSTAIVCGSLTKKPVTFEILFVLAWYMGPMSHFTYLDFVGMNIIESQAINAPLNFLLASLALIVIGLLSRKREFG